MTTIDDHYYILVMTCGKTSIGMFRLMNKNSDWIWVSGYGRVLYKNGKPDYVVTTNRIVRLDYLLYFTIML